MAIVNINSANNSTSSVSSAVIRILSGRSNGASAASIAPVATLKIGYLRANLTSSLSVISGTKSYKTINAHIMCAGVMEAYRTERDIHAEVTDYLPKYYESFATILAMLRKMSNESTRLHAKAGAVLDEFYPETASESGIVRWEKISELSGDGKTVSERRAAIAEKLRDPGVMTKANFAEMLARRFYTCSIEENPAEYAVITTILGKRGEPANISEMVTAVNALLPAHLTHEFIYTYLPWSEVDQAALTWNSADTFTWDGLETAFLI